MNEKQFKKLIELYGIKDAIKAKNWFNQDTDEQTKILLKDVQVGYCVRNKAKWKN